MGPPRARCVKRRKARERVVMACTVAQVDTVGARRAIAIASMGRVNREGASGPQMRSVQREAAEECPGKIMR